MSPERFRLRVNRTESHEGTRTEGSKSSSDGAPQTNMAEQYKAMMTAMMAEVNQAISEGIKSVKTDMKEDMRTMSEGMTVMKSDMTEGMRIMEEKLRRTERGHMPKEEAMAEWWSDKEGDKEKERRTS